MPSKHIVLRTRQALTAAFAAGVVAGAVGYFTLDRRDAAQIVWRVVRGTRFEKDVIRWHLASSRETAVRALADRRIRAGDPVEAVVAEYGPFHTETYGRYQALSDDKSAGLGGFENYILVAKDGRLTTAGWYTCTGGLTFFDTLSPAEVAQFISLRDAERERRYQNRRAADMALAGPLGPVALFEPPQPDSDANPEAGR